jgi:hypothetical protein
MPDDPPATHVEVDDGGRMLASGDIERTSEDDARVSVHVEPGHLPIGTRTRLIDAVLDHPDVQDARHITAALPRGDDEALQRVRERCDNVETRSAGASIIVDADTP